MQREIDTKFLLQTVYLTLQQFGHQEVSLKNQDLLEYVPKIKNILEENGFNDADLFLKTPVEESYAQYKNFLIIELYGKGLGYFNEKYDTIILNCPYFYIWRCQEIMKPYSEVMHQCCYVISGDIKFIEDDNIFEIQKEEVKNKHKTRKLKKQRKTVTTTTIASKDLKDPPKNLEKDFRLHGHFYPHDDIFRVD